MDCVTGFEFFVSFKIGYNGHNKEEANKALIKELERVLDEYPHTELVISEIE